jgi:hypothetical protein
VVEGVEGQQRIRADALDTAIEGGNRTAPTSGVILCIVQRSLITVTVLARLLDNNVVASRTRAAFANDSGRLLLLRSLVRKFVSTFYIRSNQYTSLLRWLPFFFGPSSC